MYVYVYYFGFIEEGFVNFVMVFVLSKGVWIVAMLYVYFFFVVFYMYKVFDLKSFLVLYLKVECWLKNEGGIGDCVVEVVKEGFDECVIFVMFLDKCV